MGNSCREDPESPTRLRFAVQQFITCELRAATCDSRKPPRAHRPRLIIHYTLACPSSLLWLPGSRIVRQSQHHQSPRHPTSPHNTAEGERVRARAEDRPPQSLSPPAPATATPLVILQYLSGTTSDHRRALLRAIGRPIGAFCHRLSAAHKNEKQSWTHLLASGGALSPAPSRMVLEIRRQ